MCARYAAHFLAVNGVAVLSSVLALARPPFQVVRYALAALEAVTRACGPAGCDVSRFPALSRVLSLCLPTHADEELQEFPAPEPQTIMQSGHWNH